MNKNDPSPREQAVLHLIRRHTHEIGDAPTTQWLSDQMLNDALRLEDIDDTSISAQWLAQERKNWLKNVLTIIGRLEEKGLVVRRGGRPQLTSRSDSYFASFHETVEIAGRHEVVPAAVPVRGRVRAGKGNDLAVDMSSSATTIPIPDIESERKVYALEVEGTSMEHEGIHGGDYVIIEEFRPNEGPGPSELIVTMYIEGSRDLGLEMDLDITKAEWSGPTLKYYYEIENENGEKGCRLGWKRGNPKKKPKDISRNSGLDEYIIWPAQIRPIGRVIGMYRRLRMVK